MLRTNLSTRPFYNERLVHLLLVALAVLVVGVSAYNLSEIFVLSGRQAQLHAQATVSDERARTLRGEAVRIRGAINPRELEATTMAAREANALIERRAFSWTDLFNRFEQTLPGNVRISSVKPRVEKDGSITIAVTVVARDVEGVDTFIENMEQQGAFSEMLSREEFMDDDALLRATIEGRYQPAKTLAAAKGTVP